MTEFSPDFIAYSENDRSRFTPPHTALVREGFVPPDKLEFDKGVLPIATTNGLQPGYYDGMGLDVRYARDFERVQLVDALESHDADNMEGQTQLLKLFKTGAVEPRWLEVWRQVSSYDATDSQAEQAFFSHLTVSSVEQARHLAELYLGVPAPLRKIVADDISSMVPALQYLADIPGIRDMADASTVATCLKTILDGYTGAKRLSRLSVSIGQLSAEVASQIQLEMAATSSGGSASDLIQSAIIRHSRYMGDGVDALLFRMACNNGVIVDPSYLLEDKYYAKLSSEPEVSFAAKLGFLRHMIAGEWAQGHNHTLLYRNATDEFASSHGGVVPDYGAIRPGNFLFHDLKLLEWGPYKQDFPLHALHAFLRGHYLHQFEMHIMDDSRQPDLQRHIANIALTMGGVDYAIPIERRPQLVVPFRALKHDFTSTQYYEYGEECYLAELVDMALQFDTIEAARGTYEDSALIGELRYGRHVAALLNDIHGLGKSKVNKALAVVTEQLLLMRGHRLLGSRDDLRLSLDELFAHDDGMLYLSVDHAPEKLSGNELATSRPPLTCYYEWFKRYARPVSRQELARRGVPYVDPLF